MRILKEAREKREAIRNNKVYIPKEKKTPNKSTSKKHLKSEDTENEEEVSHDDIENPDIFYAISIKPMERKPTSRGDFVDLIKE